MLAKIILPDQIICCSKVSQLVRDVGVFLQGYGRFWLTQWKGDSPATGSVVGEYPRDPEDSCFFPDRKRSRKRRGVLGVSGGLGWAGESPTLRSLSSRAVSGSSFGEVKLLGLVRSTDDSAVLRPWVSMVGRMWMVGKEQLEQKIVLEALR